MFDATEPPCNSIRLKPKFVQFGDGTWALNDKGEICRTYNTPVPGMPNPTCIAWAAHKIGDSWQITVNGRTSEVTLVAGIQ